jgi:hypothetical protein
VQVRTANQGMTPGMRFQTKALLALQEAAEAHLVGVFEDMNLLALHSKRVTVRPTDLKLVQRLSRCVWCEARVQAIRRRFKMNPSPGSGGSTPPLRF